MDAIKEIEGLLRLEDEAFAMYQVYTDPIKRKIPAQDIHFIIYESMKCGQEEAEKLLAGYYQGTNNSNFDIYRLISHLNILLKEEPGESSMDYICFGFFEEPASITLFTNHIKNVVDFIQKYKIKKLWDVNIKDIILAHEIFHYIEAKDKNLFVNRHRIKLWRLGPYTHTSTLVSSREIAAMSFAKKLLNLSFCPTVLDFLLLISYNLPINTQDLLSLTQLPTYNDINI